MKFDGSLQGVPYETDARKLEACESIMVGEEGKRKAKERGV